MRPETTKLLWDAREACRLVREFVAGRTYGDYQDSPLLRSAVERQLSIVGEALRRVSRLDPEVSESVPDLEHIVGFRNALVHGYDAISNRVVWDIVERDVPRLLTAPGELLGR